MKYIITEQQSDNLEKSLEKKSDMIFDIFKMLYPDYEETYLGYTNETEVKSEDDELLFFFRWGRKEFLVSAEFLNTLGDWIGNVYDENNREMFEKLFTVFAKRHFGWNVEYVGIHYY
jgi:hypothetical protein